jgi:hypothetical protein
MAELKEHLSGEDGVRALAGVLEAQPECTNEDILAMAGVLEGGETPGDDFLTCHPPDDFIEKYTPHIEVIFRRSLEDVPDKINVTEDVFGDIGGAGEPSTLSLFGTQVSPFTLIRWVRWVIRMSPLFAWATLLVIAFFGASSFKGLGGWWGVPLFVSGLIAFGIAFLATPVANWVVNRFISDQTVMGISPVLMETGTDLVIQMIRSLFTQARNLALITAGLGIVFFVIATVLGNLGKQDDTLVD